MTSTPARSVLIVEDDPMVRRLLARHFQKSGATVTEAADAEAGSAAFKQPEAQFDVVITDVHLPGRTGLELANELHLLRPDQPIVFVTGDVDETLARRALKGGKAGYLLKPFEFFELDAAVAQAIQSATPPPPSPTAMSVDPADRSGWYAEQRRRLEEAAQRPLDVRVLVSHSHKKVEQRRVLLKIAVVVVILVGLAWIIGYGLFPERTPLDQPATTPAEAEQRTIYVPYEAPQRREPARERSR